MPKGLSTWRKMVDLWNLQNVPQTEIRPFENNMPFAYWHSKDGPYTCDTNPLKTTAYHLAVHLNDCPSDLLAVYKIFSFCFDRDIVHLHSDALESGFRQFDEDMRGWWRQNTKTVLPYASAGGLPEEEDLARWDHVVVAAARAWEAIASQWVIVRVPELMLRDSAEKHAWDELLRKRHLERERQEYERLKLKFG